MTDSNQSSGEREAIVAWLLKEARRFNTQGDDLDNQWRSADYNHASHLAEAAAAIKRGDHLLSPPTQEN